MAVTERQVDRTVLIVAEHCFELTFGLEFPRISLLGQLHLYDTMAEKLCRQSSDCTKVNSALTGSNLLMFLNVII